MSDVDQTVTLRCLSTFLILISTTRLTNNSIKKEKLTCQLNLDQHQNSLSCFAQVVLIKLVAMAAQREIAKALETPIRKGVLFGDIVINIFEVMPLEPEQAQFPLDLAAILELKPSTSLIRIRNGRIPERHVEGDYVMVNTYGISSSTTSCLSMLVRLTGTLLLVLCKCLNRPSLRRSTTMDGTLLAAAVDRKHFGLITTLLLANSPSD